MFYEIEKVVFLENGNLYCYDVINIIIVILINIEEVIIVDGWEKLRVVVVVNGIFLGLIIIVYED